ncbi:hypothetical protein RB195_026076 [Necator americanus]|uniref:Uncharacterized protein n=1 Tax=Necator americanus TaxID=51031 RepID=A0ABR1EVE9_NECAM
MINSTILVGTETWQTQAAIDITTPQSEKKTTRDRSCLIFRKFLNRVLVKSARKENLDGLYTVFNSIQAIPYYLMNLSQNMSNTKTSSMYGNPSVCPQLHRTVNVEEKIKFTSSEVHTVTNIG